MTAEEITAECPTVKDQFPGVPWQQPSRLRIRIVHGYWSIDLEVLHTTATEQLPAFTADLRTVLGSVTDSARVMAAPVSRQRHHARQVNYSAALSPGQD